MLHADYISIVFLLYDVSIDYLCHSVTRSDEINYRDALHYLAGCGITERRLPWNTLRTTLLISITIVHFHSYINCDSFEHAGKTCNEGRYDCGSARCPRRTTEQKDPERRGKH